MKDRRGLTLVELVVAITIMGLSVPVLLTLFAFVAKPSAQTDSIIRCTELAHALMDQVTSKWYDELTAKDVNGDWSVIGPDTGETGSSLYDDVDDYNGFSEALTGNLAGFTRTVVVQYAAVSGMVVVADTSRTNNYKLITVTVTGPGGGSAQVVNLATTANNQQAT
ncbi:MAG: prepilin-type N-terminal cleavage/methylation domain-containing protein [Candidatus Omnitrophica bacterium]|nr:prepilin-type N-terminal cleavage/methylation domain-containing protein [Candidatus Omnitrophota bacterium]